MATHRLVHVVQCRLLCSDPHRRLCIDLPQRTNESRGFAGDSVSGVLGNPSVLPSALWCASESTPTLPGAEVGVPAEPPSGQ